MRRKIKSLLSRSASDNASPIPALQDVENSLQSVGLPEVRVAMDSFLNLLKCINSKSHSIIEIDQLDGYLRRLAVAVFGPLVEVPTEDLPPELTARVLQLAKSLQKIAHDLSTSVKKKNAGKRLVVEKEDGVLDVAEMNRKIKSVLEVFTMQGRIELEMGEQETQMLVTQVLNKQDEMQKEREYQAALTLLRNIPNAHASFSSNSTRLIRTCHEGTRVEFLASIKTWRLNPKANRILWITGITGIGKSTIARTIAKEAYEEDKLCASFFFSRSEGHADPNTVFTSIAYQLAHFQYAPFQIYILDALKDKPELQFADPQTQMKELIIQPLGEIAQTPKGLVIVMDALDECDEQAAIEVLANLISFAERIPWMKIVIASRPERHLRLLLEKTSHIHFSLHDIDQATAESDVRLYLRYRLEHVGDVLPERRDSWRWTEAEFEGLAKKAGTVFLYAVIAADFIEDVRQCNPRRQLMILLNNTTDDYSPYQELDDLYLRVITETIPPGIANTHLAEEFVLVVGTIATLVVPLPFTPIERLIGVEQGDFASCLSRLHSIIPVSRYSPTDFSKTPRIAHPSFPEFLADARRCTDSRFLLVPEDHHRRLAMACLNCMTSLLKKNICGITDPFLLNARIESLPAKVKKCIPHELAYACRYWADHLAKVPLQDLGVMAILSTFVMEYLLYWMEVLSLTDEARSAISAMPIAYNWAMASNCTEDITSMLEEASRIATSSSWLIRLSAMHIYTSIIPFLPLQSRIYEAYRHQSTPSAIVLTGREETWQVGEARLKELPDDKMRCMRFSPDGGKLVIGSERGVVEIRNALTGEVDMVDKSHEGAITALAFSQDSFQLATGSEDKNVRLWPNTSEAEHRILEGHHSTIVDITCSAQDDKICSTSTDGVICIWDTSESALLSTFQTNLPDLSSVSFHPHTSRIIISKTKSDVLRIWDVSTRSPTPPRSNSTAISASHPSQTIPITFSDGTSCLLESISNTIVMLERAPTGSSLKTQTYEDRTAIIYGAEMKTVCWLPSDIEVVKEESHINKLAFSARDGRFFLLDFSRLHL